MHIFVDQCSVQELGLAPTRRRYHHQPHSLLSETMHHIESGNQHQDVFVRDDHPFAHHRFVLLEGQRRKLLELGEALRYVFLFLGIITHTKYKSLKGMVQNFCTPRILSDP